MDFDWVKRRAECSAFEIFRQLREGEELDVEARNKQLPPPNYKHFRMGVPLNSSAGKFSVLCEGHNLEDAVDFTCSDDGKIITMHGEDKYSATVTLNRQGDCVTACDGEELSNWQFRQLVLERFFRF